MKRLGSALSIGGHGLDRSGGRRGLFRRSRRRLLREVEAPIVAIGDKSAALGDITGTSRPTSRRRKFASWGCGRRGVLRERCTLGACLRRWRGAALGNSGVG